MKDSKLLLFRDLLKLKMDVIYLEKEQGRSE